MYWISLAKYVMFSRAYTITSLSLSKNIVIGCLLTIGCWAAATES
jgi:hypothetical protein